MAFLTPHVEIEDLGGRQRRLTVHVAPVAYRDEGGVLRAIDPTWVDSGDATRPHLVSAAPLLITVAPDGMRRLHPTRDINVYLEIGAPYIKPAGTWTKVNLGTPTRSAGLLTWTTTNANVYVAHGGHFVKLAILLKGGWQPPNGQFAFPVGLTGLSRNGNDLLRDGVVVGRVRKPHVEDFDNPEDVRPLTHEFVRLQGQDYILFTLPDLTGMSRPLIDPTYDETPDPTSGLDTELRQGSATSNFGTDTAVGANASATVGRTGLIKFDLSSIPGDATIDDATLYVYNATLVGGAATLTWYRILAANSTWTEAAATWNKTDGSTNWAGDTGGDGGADAGCSVSGTDYSSTAIGSSVWASSEAVDTEHIITLNTTEFAAMVDANHGMAMRPRLVVNYTLAGAEFSASLTAASSASGASSLAVARYVLSANTAESSSQASLRLEVARYFSLSLTAESATTSAASLAVARYLAVTLTAVSSASNTVDLVTEALISLLASLTAQSSSASASLALARYLTSSATAQSSTADSVSKRSTLFGWLP